jgi:hypothetical protein
LGAKASKRGQPQARDATGEARELNEKGGELIIRVRDLILRI